MNDRNAIYVLLFLIGTVFGLTSCEKEMVITGKDFLVQLPVEAPTVAYVGRELTVPVAVSSKTGIQKVETRLNFQPLQGTTQEDYGGADTGTYLFRYTPTRFDLGKSLSFVIAAFDSQGYTRTTNYTVKVEEAPVHITITFPEEIPESIDVGESLSLQVQVVSELPMQEIATLVNGVLVDDLTKSTFSDPLQDNYLVAYTPADAEAGRPLELRVRVTDNEGKVKEAAVTLTVTGTPAGKALKVFNGIYLGGQNSTEHGHFLDATAGKVYMRQGVAAISDQIDLLCFISGASTGVNVTAPNFSNAAQFIYTVANSGDDALANWPVRNATKLKRLENDGQAAFDALEEDTQLKELYEASGMETDNVNKLAADDVVLFKTVDGHYGVFLVKTPVPSTNKESLQLDYKISE